MSPTSPIQLTPLCPPWSIPGLSTTHAPPPSPDILNLHQPDEHWLARASSGQLLARCSLWWRSAPSLPGHTLGIIGHYSADHDIAADALLRHVIQRLQEAGCTLAVGPMDGSTWRRYRFITERGPEPPFFLEPDHPSAWLEQWRRAGFEALATYFSAVNADLSHEDEQVTQAGQRLETAGVRLRHLQMDRWREELRLIFSLSIRSFASNYLYTPISEDEFLRQYEPLQDRLRPDLVHIAEQGAEPVGFIFAVPDWTQAARGLPVDTAIVKTVAVLPERRCAGLGAWLLAQSQITARQLGFRRVIHALMHESNASLNLSARYATIFRKYQLLARPLGSA